MLQSIRRQRPGPVAQATPDNADEVGLAFDDREETAWTGQGLISLRLARPRLHEITARVSGFRGRALPISVTADDQEVFRGPTPRSLGYFTLSRRKLAARLSCSAWAGRVNLESREFCL